MKKIRNFIIILLIGIMTSLNLPLYSFAFAGTTSLEGILTGADDFLEIGKNEGTPINESGLKTLSNMISGVLLTIAIAVTLISAVMMGINFLMQSIEEKAKIKESMVPWIIGIVVAFGAYGIWEITTKIFMAL